MGVLLKRAMGMYKMEAVKRSIMVWLAFQVVLWTVFGATYALNSRSWAAAYEIGSPVVPPEGLIKTRKSTIWRKFPATHSVCLCRGSPSVLI